MCVALLTVMVADAGIVMLVPPDRTIAPEPDAKVMLPELSTPETLMVPAPSTVAPLPKLTRSVVAVVMLAPGAAAPVPSVFHWLSVGSAHMPPAVPKPELAASLSQ